MFTSTMNWTIIFIFFLFISLCASDSSVCKAPRLKNGRIRARGRGKIIRYSCYADFELVGNKYSTCIRGSWDTPTPICVSTRCPSIPVPEHAVVGEKYRGAILMYFCEPGYTLVGNSEIYCDGRQWNATTPYCRNLNSIAPTSCDFEKDALCWWEQDPKHDFDWIRHRFDTPSSHIGTGPTHDHTLGSGYDGYYLYIEASGRLINDSARIISPLYSANYTDSGCFSFWYHMYGSTIGALNVYFKLETEKVPKLMWSKSGNQGNQWLQGLFQLPPANASFQIIMEGVRGLSYVSDIAIDDLAILQGDQCVIKNVTTSTPPNDGDEVEIFNANQSCKDRCVNSVSETSTPSSEVYSNPDLCQCTIDCAETHSCCPDFAEYCIYEMTDPMETTLFVSNSSHTTTLLTSTGAQISELLTQKPTTITTAAAKPTTKINEFTLSSAATQATETRMPTTAGTKTSTPAEPTTAETPTTVSKEETIYLPSVKPITSGLNVETPFVVELKTAFTTNAPTEARVHVEEPRRLSQSINLSLSGTISIVVGILTGVTMTTVMTLFILRRRKSYKRGSKGSAFSEDSDVRFLTSDEVLDFNLAKPAGDYEEM